MRILFIAADRMEFGGMLRLAEDVRKEHVPIDFARRARIGGHEALLAANGAGWQRAAAAVEACDGFAPEAIVSTGYCGALDGSLGIAEIVGGTEIVAKDLTARCHVITGTPHSGRIASIDHVAQTAEEKRELGKFGAKAVEMEAGGVCNSAEIRGIPFYCVRVVTDLACESMANDFNGALRSDGHFDTIKILRGALCRPIVRFPELLRLRSRCIRASRVLGEFFVGCRF
jgi:nucleoside phosphorylase